MVNSDENYDMEHWLKGRPREFAIVIAARAALRAVPALATAIHIGMIGRGRQSVGTAMVLPTFRSIAASWASVMFPSHKGEIRAAARAAATAASGADAVALVAPAARAAVRTARAAADAAASTNLGARTAVTRSIGSAVAFATHDAVNLDGAVAAGTSSQMAVFALARQPLWLKGVPEWVPASWHLLKKALLDVAEDWEVWTDWYEARLVGGRVNETLELERVLIPEEIWELGPKRVNAHIKALIEKHRSEPPKKPDETVEPVPSQAPGPHYRADADGRIDSAPSGEADAQGNDRQTIDQLKPLVLQCAAALEARLSKNEFPELLASVQQYRGALAPNDATPIEWGTVWGTGVLLQNAADAAEREIKNRTLPELEDPAKTALDSLLRLHGPMILATAEGVKLSERAAGFAMTREQQEALRTAAEEVVERLKADKDIITPRAAETVSAATDAIGQGRHPERGSVYGLANLKNVSIVLIGGAAAATPALIGTLLGVPIVGAVVGAPLSLVVVEAVKKSAAFSALVTQLGARLDSMSDAELQVWLDERARRLAPFRGFVILNQEPLRRIAETTPELRWMLRYIDFIVADPET